MSKFSTTQSKLTKKLKEILINIGLNHKEAAVYLATLELNEDRAAAIAQHAKLNRVTTYDILQKLMAKAYVSATEKDGVKRFTALDPSLLLQDVRKHQEEFEHALPEFLRLHGRSHQPRVIYYEGLAGIKRIYQDQLKSKTEILNYANSKRIREFWPNYDQEFVAERAKRKIFLRGLTLDDEDGRNVVAENAKYYRDIRTVKPNHFHMTNEINIYEDKVSIISFGKNELIGMLIHSPEIAETQKGIFMMLWEHTKA